VDTDRPYATHPSPGHARGVLPDRPTRRDYVLAFCVDDIAVPPLAFSLTIEDMKEVLHYA
jgi:hypothetical protein